MSMGKKDFIALADAIKEHNKQITANAYPGYNAPTRRFNLDQIAALADFCEGQNFAFNRDRWLSYINGECGPNGGEVK